MSNECKIFEMGEPRVKNAPIRKVPFLAKQQLSTTNVSAAFNKSTKMITIVSSLAGTVEFSRFANGADVDPDGNGMTFPISADVPYDFDVMPGKKVRFV